MDGLGFFKEFGLLGIVIGAVILLLFLVIKWTLSTTRDILKQAAEERKAWNDAVSRVADNINRHDEKADERAKYVRSEHEKMIEILNRMNGYHRT